MSKIVAYACSTRPNALWSAAQFDSAAPKNRTECDIPLVALSDLEAERQRTDSLKALCDEMAKEARRQALEEAEKIAEREYKRHCTGSGFDSQPARATAHSILEAIRSLAKAKEADHG